MWLLVAPRAAKVLMVMRASGSSRPILASTPRNGVVRGSQPETTARKSSRRLTRRCPVALQGEWRKSPEQLGGIDPIATALGSGCRQPAGFDRAEKRGPVNPDPFGGVTEAERGHVRMDACTGEHTVIGLCGKRSVKEAVLRAPGGRSRARGHGCGTGMGAERAWAIGPG